MNAQYQIENSGGNVYQKPYFSISLLTAALLGLSIAYSANAQNTAPETPAAAPAQVVTAGTVHGHIADPTGAVIPGAKITLADPSGTAITTVTSDAAGNYTIPGVKPGTYIVEAFYEGFAPFTSPTIQLPIGQSKRIDIAMAIEVDQQNVVVTDESAGLSTDSSNNAGALVLKDKDLDALSDDPDELSSELQALAGPSAGPNGGQIYIDGFSGGQLPPKSAIREIRINQNPYSAEYDHPGFGRIEILTKPGTDKLHGNVMMMGNDSNFNTGNPFTPNIPEYHTFQINASVGGSLSKIASYFFSFEQRNNSTPSLYTTTAVPVLGPGGFYTVSTAQANTSGAIYRPSVNTEISPRIDIQLGPKHTVTVRYQYERSNAGYSLSSAQKTSLAVPTQSTQYSDEHSIQASDSWILNSHAVNETRFRYNRSNSNRTPSSQNPGLSVSGAFSTGGGSVSNGHSDQLELQNLTTMSIGAHALKFGVRLRDNRSASFSNGGYNGSFTFNDVNDLNAALNHENGTPCPTGTSINCTPLRLSYTRGPSASLSTLANTFDAGLFIQDDWKVNRFLTLSGGLRWESQTHITDHSDFAPRIAIAYALNGHKNGKQPTSLVRLGYGFFYDRMNVSNLWNTVRYNGDPNGQQTFTITNPTCFSSTSLNTVLPSCGAATANTANSTTYQFAPHYQSPVMEQGAISLEQQLSKTTKVAATYIHTFGVHQLATRNANAYTSYDPYNPPVVPASRPNSSLGVVNEYFPEAVFKQEQLIVNVNTRISTKLSLAGFYNFNYAHANTGTASNSYNLNDNYGRAPFAATNNVFLFGNYQGPWKINFSPFLAAHSGNPFNITIAQDMTGDNFFNSRPGVVDASNCSSTGPRYVQTSYGCLDSTPQPGEAILAANSGNGPKAIAFNLRVARAFGIGPKVEKPAAKGQDPSMPMIMMGGGPGGGGGRGGGGGMRGGPGGPGGMGGMSGTGRKYSLNFSVQALNLFNNINYAPPNGNITPFSANGSYQTNFGKYTSLANRPFSSGPSVRSVFLQAMFSF